VVRLHIPRAQPNEPLLLRLRGLAAAYTLLVAASLRLKRYTKIVVSTSPPLGFAPLCIRARLLGEAITLVHYDIFPENAELIGAIHSNTAGNALQVLA